jgi:hypothetical protein
MRSLTPDWAPRNDVLRGDILNPLLGQPRVNLRHRGDAAMVGRVCLRRLYPLRNCKFVAHLQAGPTDLGASPVTV